MKTSQAPVLRFVGIARTRDNMSPQEALHAVFYSPVWHKYLPANALRICLIQEYPYEDHHSAQDKEAIKRASEKLNQAVEITKSNPSSIKSFPFFEALVQEDLITNRSDITGASFTP